MKKVLGIAALLMMFSGAAFAEVTAKKLKNGKIEATFFYGNPKVKKVMLAGDFTQWQEGWLEMKKVKKGFSLTKVFDAGTKVTYKFVADDNWTTDIKAPDFVEDGFGGKNSFADLDAIAK